MHILKLYIHNKFYVFPEDQDSIKVFLCMTNSFHSEGEEF